MKTQYSIKISNFNRKVAPYIDCSNNRLCGSLKELNLVHGLYTKVEEQIEFLENYLKGGDRFELIKSWSENNNFDMFEANYYYDFAKDWGLTIGLIPQFDYFNSAIVLLDVKYNVVRMIEHLDTHNIGEFVYLNDGAKIYSYHVEHYLAFLKWWLSIKNTLKEPQIVTFEWVFTISEIPKLESEIETYYNSILPQLKKDLILWENRETEIECWERKINNYKC